MTSILELDARRLLCPMPVIRLQDFLKLQIGGVQVKVICTDPGTQYDIPTWCRINGHDVVASQVADDEYVFIVEKGMDNS